MWVEQVRVVAGAQHVIKGAGVRCARGRWEYNGELDGRKECE